MKTLSYTFTNAAGVDYSTTSPVAYLHDSTHGNTMSAPYGLAIDRSGNVWVSNASCVTISSTVCTPVGFTLSELIGAAYPTVTPLAAQTIGTTEGVPPAQIVPGGPVAQRQSAVPAARRHGH